jgi:trimeric autotransporter adhesin
MTIKRYAGDKLVGLSSDTKPTNIPDGATFYETDTLTPFLLVSGSWSEVGGGGAALELYAENPSSPTAPSATGSNAVAIGSGAIASDTRAVALGLSRADGDDAVAIGIGATNLTYGARANGALAAGYQASATALQASAVGTNATASGSRSNAFGYETDATNTNSNAFGSFAQSVGTNSTAIGRAYASGEDSFAAAIANNTATYGATGANSVAIGYQARATNDRTTSIGYTSTASGNHSSAYGHGASATGAGANAVGYGSSASGSFANALGYSARAIGDNSVSLGRSYSLGTESFSAIIADTTTTYGATGANSVAIGYQAKASNSYAFAVGQGNIASAFGSVAIGRNSTASGNYSVTIGNQAVAVQQSKMAFSAGRFSTDGDAQAGTFVLRSDTTDATPEALTTDNSAAGTTNQVILPNNSAYSFSGTIIARESAATGSDYASWEIKGALLRDANAASTVLGNGIRNKLYATAGAAAWDIDLTADTTNGGLAITVTGAAATSIRWVATINTSEVTYA